MTTFGELMVEGQLVWHRRPRKIENFRKAAWIPIDE